MRRGKILLLTVICVMLFIAFLFSAQPVNAFAQTEEEGRAELNATIEELISSLDTKELQEYLDSLSELRGISIKDKLKSVITGDFALEYSSLGSAILNLVWEEVQSLFPAFAIILAVALLCGILNSAKSGFMNSTMSDIINFVGYLSVGAVVLSCLITVLRSCFSCISSMQRQMELVFPLLLTLISASGGAVSVAVYRPAVAFLSGGITELFTTIVLPLSVVVIILAFVSNLTEEAQTGRLSDFFKSMNKWIIGLVLGLFTLFLSVQGIASGAYDGISLRAVKYVLTGSVPLVGGFLSGSLEFVIAGSALIKNALGAFSLFLLVATILKPLVLFMVFQLFLRLAAAVTEPVGGKTSAFLARLAGDMSYFLAGLLCIAFLYFLTLLLLVCSAGVIF